MLYNKKLDERIYKLLKKIPFTKNITTSNSDKYVSIYEENINEINNKQGARYIIEFQGYKEENVSIILNCTGYSNNKQITNFKVDIGKSISVVFNSAEYININVYAKGYGNFNIDSIYIYQYIKDEINEYNDLVKYKLNIPNRLENLKLACIFDDFTRECFKHECNIIDIRPDSWKVDFLLHRPHIFMMESAWSGKDDLWRGIISSGNENKLKKLIEIVEWCKSNSIPTVFWNKEDPVHFDKFIVCAKYFDYVFTTDKDSIPKYENILKHNRVYTLMFAAQPQIHNPIKYTNNKSSKACFAGTYYKKKFPDRCNDLDKLLNAAMNTIGVEIFDRKYNTRLLGFEYPDKFKMFVKGYLKPQDLHISNKGYRVTINVNSVSDSNTMFSRRVFESMSSGTPVISSYSRAINSLFKEIVFMSDKEIDLEDEFLRLSKDNHYYDKKVIQGIRAVLNNNTYKDRLLYVLDKLQINITPKNKQLCIISKVDNIEDIQRSIEIYTSQVYPYKTLYLFTNDITLSNKNDGIVYIFYDNKTILIEEILKGDYVGVINTKNHYGENYFNDLINATLYTDAEFIGKNNYYKRTSVYSDVYEIGDNCDFQYVMNLDLDKSILNKSILKNTSLEEFIEIIKSNELNMHKFGYRYFSIDKYNLIVDYYSYNNHSKDLIKNINI